MMARHLALVLLSLILTLEAWCQTVQDSWTAPATPDGSTSLQSGAPFTIRWKPELQEAFPILCTSCDVMKLDLWVTSFEDASYNFKIAGSVDITTTSSYQWDVNIPSAALVANDYWVLRFTAVGAPVGPDNPYTEQISSSGFYISGPPQPSTVISTVAGPQPSTVINTVTALQSSTVIDTVPAQPSTKPPICLRKRSNLKKSAGSPSSVSTSSIASSKASASTTPSSAVTDTPLAQKSNPWNKSWIAGAVSGLVVGLALVAVLLWFLSKRKRKDDMTRYTGADSGHGEYAFQSAGLTYRNGKADDALTIARPPQVCEMAGDWQHQDEGHGQNPVEMPGSTSEREPAELCSGNDKSGL